MTDNVIIQVMLSHLQSETKTTAKMFLKKQKLVIHPN
jgi:hypothetical protein